MDVIRNDPDGQWRIQLSLLEPSIYKICCACDYRDMVTKSPHYVLGGVVKTYERTLRLVMNQTWPVRDHCLVCVRFKQYVEQLQTMFLIMQSRVLPYDMKLVVDHWLRVVLFHNLMIETTYCKLRFLTEQWMNAMKERVGKDDEISGDAFLSYYLIVNNVWDIYDYRSFLKLAPMKILNSMKEAKKRCEKKKRTRFQYKKCINCHLFQELLIHSGTGLTMNPLFAYYSMYTWYPDKCVHWKACKITIEKTSGLMFCSRVCCFHYCNREKLMIHECPCNHGLSCY